MEDRKIEKKIAGVLVVATQIVTLLFFAALGVLIIAATIAGVQSLL